MPKRSAFSDKYRFGFNGKEKDDEINGITGAHLDFGARMYSSALGRWWSLDNKSKGYQSNYVFAANNPIIFIDPDGNDDYYYDKSTNSYNVIRTGAPHRFYTYNDNTPVEGGGFVSTTRTATSREIGYMLANNSKMRRDAIKHASTREERQGLYMQSYYESTRDSWKIGLGIVAVPFAVIGAAEFGGFMATQYGRKVAKDFIRDVAIQFAANMILTEGDVEESFYTVDYANAALSAFSGNTLKTKSKSLEVLRKSLTAFAQTSLDLSISGGADLKTGSGSQDDIVNYYTDLITRQLFAQISLPADDDFIKGLSGTARKTLRSLVQTSVETLFNEEATMNHNAGNIKEKE